MADERRLYLKQLAARSARAWGSTPLPACFAGETRIETRNTIYQLRDGVCYAVTRRDDASPGRLHPSAYVGMRIVGWLMRDRPQAGISLEWKTGAYAVLWRPRDTGEEHSAVALTSTSLAFRRIAHAVPAPARRVEPETVRPGRRSAPPPLPLAVQRGSLLPQPATPPSWVPAPPGPPPLSTTRLHLGDIPSAPETPTPVSRRPSSPPPLPARAQGIKPLPPRVLS